MKSNNPVFARSEEFNGTANTSANPYGNQTYAGSGQAYPGYGQTPAGQGYGDPAQWGTGTPGQVDQGRMTVDSVVQKTAITLAVVSARSLRSAMVKVDAWPTRSRSARADSRDANVSMASAASAYISTC